jgi:hypothetical protein
MLAERPDAGAYSAAQSGGRPPVAQSIINTSANFRGKYFKSGVETTVQESRIQLELTIDRQQVGGNY